MCNVWHGNSCTHCNPCDWCLGGDCSDSEYHISLLKITSSHLGVSCLNFCGVLFLQLLTLVMFLSAKLLLVYDLSDVWCRGLTIFPLYVGKLFQNLVLYDSWSVRSVPLVTINQITDSFFTKGHLKLKTCSDIKSQTRKASISAVCLQGEKGMILSIMTYGMRGCNGTYLFLASHGS